MGKTNVKWSKVNELSKPRMSLEQCKTILKKHGENYTDNEIKEIRDFLYNLIDIDYSMFQQHMKEKAEQYIQVEENESEGKVIQLNANEEFKLTA